MGWLRVCLALLVVVGIAGCALPEQPPEPPLSIDGPTETVVNTSVELTVSLEGTDRPRHGIPIEINGEPAGSLTFEDSTTSTVTQTFTEPGLHTVSIGTEHHSIAVYDNLTTPVRRAMANLTAARLTGRLNHSYTFSGVHLDHEIRTHSRFNDTIRRAYLDSRYETSANGTQRYWRNTVWYHHGTRGIRVDPFSLGIPSEIEYDAVESSYAEHRPNFTLLLDHVHPTVIRNDSVQFRGDLEASSANAVFGPSIGRTLPRPYELENGTIELSVNRSTGLITTITVTGRMIDASLEPPPPDSGPMRWTLSIDRTQRVGVAVPPRTVLEATMP